MGLLSKASKNTEKKLQEHYEKQMDNAQRAWKAGYYRGNDVRLFELYRMMMSNPVSTSTMNNEEKVHVAKMVLAFEQLKMLNQQKQPYDDRIDSLFKTILT